MLLEILITLEVLAFIFLALGLMPAKSGDGGKSPLINKVIFIVIAGIIFFSLAANSVSYDYTHCYVNASTMDYSANTTTNLATCNTYLIENLGLSYINWGMGVIAMLVATIIILIAGFSRNDDLYGKDQAD